MEEKALSVKTMSTS